MDKLKTETQRHYLTFKLSFLEDQRNKFVAAIEDHVNRVLHMGRSWLEDGDGNSQETFKTFTFREISHLIEDTTMFVTHKCAEMMSGDDQSSSSAAPATPDTLTPIPLMSSSGQAADERDTVKMVMSRVTVIEKAISSISTDVDKISQRQIDVEKCAAKAEKVEKLETRLQQLEKDLGCLKRDGTKLRSHVDCLEGSLNYDKTIETFKQKFEKLEEMGKKVKKIDTVGKKVEKLEVIEEKMDQLETMQQRIKKLEVKGENTENLEDLQCRLEQVEDQILKMEKLDIMTQKIEKIEDMTHSLTCSVDAQDSSVQEMTRSTHANRRAVEKNAEDRERDQEQLRDVQERLTVVERKENKALRRLGVKFGDVEKQYKMVCQIVADRLAPLEQLRDIFNKNIKRREQNIDKLNEVAQQVSVMMPKLSQLEIMRNQPGVGISVASDWFLPVQGNIVENYQPPLCNEGCTFHSMEGKVTVPVDGLYGICLYMWQSGGQRATFNVNGAPSGTTVDPENNRQVIVASTDINSALHKSIFELCRLQAGYMLYTSVKSVEGNDLRMKTAISCFLIK